MDLDWLLWIVLAGWAAHCIQVDATALPHRFPPHAINVKRVRALERMWTLVAFSVVLELSEAEGAVWHCSHEADRSAHT